MYKNITKIINIFLIPDTSDSLNCHDKKVTFNLIKNYRSQKQFLAFDFGLNSAYRISFNF